MTITVMNDYLVFPVYTHSTNKKIVFQYEGETIDQLNIKLDNTEHCFLNAVASGSCCHTCGGF